MLVVLHPFVLWLLPAFCAAVLLLYAFARRRVRLTVPSIVIWRRVAEGAQHAGRKSGFMNREVILSLAAVSMLVLAAAGPRWFSRAAGRQPLAFIIDNGTAMSSSGANGKTRLAEAIELVKDVLRAEASSTEALCIVTSPSPAVVVGPVTGGEAARLLHVAEAGEAGKAGAVIQSYVSGSLADSTALAFAVLGRRTTVRVYTSRPVPTEADAWAEQVVVGRASNNMAIVAADFCDSIAFCALHNYSGSATACSLVVKACPVGSRTGETGSTKQAWSEAASRTVKLAAGERKVFEFPVALEKAGTVEIVLKHPGDDLEADNRVFAVRSKRSNATVAVVGEVPKALERALNALGYVDVVKLAAARQPLGARGGRPPRLGGSGRSGMESFDLVAYCGVQPESTAPTRNLLLVRPPIAGSFGPLTFTGRKVRGVRGVRASAEDELTAPLDLGFLRIRQADEVRVTGAVRRLIEDDAGHLLAAAWREGGRRIYWLGFSLDDSNWPEDPTWPIFIERCMREVVGVRPGEFSFVRIGESPGRVVPGLFESAGGLLAVNLLDERESDNRPAPPRKRSEKAEAAEQEEADESTPGRPLDAPLILLAACAMLLRKSSAQR